MNFFSEALKSLTNLPFTYSEGAPKTETEYREKVKIVKSEDELTSEGLPDWNLVKKKQEDLQVDYDSKQYQRDRQYPSIQDQLDMLYWDRKNGTKTWEESIDKVKADNPKPE